VARVKTGRRVKATRRIRVDTSGQKPRWTQFPSRRTHDLSKSAPYAAWNAMKQRCRRTGEKLYGPWRAFEAFRRDMGPRPDGTVLRRRDETREWGPGNACWAVWDPKTQTAVLPPEDRTNEWE
jgi:hypothetical protein